MQQYYLTTRESLTEAIRLAHRALELDPRLGSAAALAGDCHASNVALGYANDPQFDCKEAVRLACRAIESNCRVMKCEDQTSGGHERLFTSEH